MFARGRPLLYPGRARGDSVNGVTARAGDSMVDASVTRRKMRKLDEHLGRRSWRNSAGCDPSLSRLTKASLLHRRAIERLLQLLVSWSLPATPTGTFSCPLATRSPTYYDNFIRMGEVGVIPRVRAWRLAPTAGVRYILVHELRSDLPFMVRPQEW